MQKPMGQAEREHYIGQLAKKVVGRIASMVDEERKFMRERLQRCREARDSRAVRGEITTFYDEWIINEIRDQEEKRHRW